MRQVIPVGPLWTGLISTEMYVPNTSSPIQYKLVVQGAIVKIDESRFGKRKYNHGRYGDGHWVFGGIKRGTNEALWWRLQTDQLPHFFQLLDNTSSKEQQ